jgi:hypothetical protein
MALNDLCERAAGPRLRPHRTKQAANAVIDLLTSPEPSR